MKLNIVLTLFVIIITLTLIISFEDAYADETIEVEVKYTNGDRADFSGMKFIVYQDFDKSPILEKHLESNPDFITVPENHRYKIEINANGMYADIGYIQLDNSPKKLNINIPLSGGIQFEIFYKNGETPIEGATVILKSQDNVEWRQGLTNDQGETTRYWIQSTTKQEDHYIADVYLEELFLTSFSPIKLQPGISTNQKIITNVPKIVEELITINLYDKSQKITSADGKYGVILRNLQETDTVTSNVNFRGDAQFSNLKSGTYSVKIISNNELENILWPETLIQITGDVNRFNILKNSMNIIEQENPFFSCKCISFRLDDIQDYWLADTQIELIDLFKEKNIPLTVGVIGSRIGSDENITSVLKENIENNNIEIASHSWNNDVLTNMNKTIQEKYIIDTNKKIFEVFGISPITFIPPENLYNEDTVNILKNNGFTHLSSYIDENEFADIDEDLFYKIPAITQTAKLDKATSIWTIFKEKEVKEQIIQNINQRGYAVVMMHPQEFSLNDDGEYDIPNQKTISELRLLLDELVELNTKIVKMNDIPIQQVEPKSIEKVPPKEEIKKQNETCNCVAFRLNDVQDYWLNEVQIEIMKTFIENDTPLTIGIIANAFGNDQKITEFVKQNIREDRNYLEIATKGVGLTQFTNYNKVEQNQNLKDSLDLIESNIHIRPQIFIPPGNQFNSDTFEILEENNITHISSSLINGESPPFEFKGEKFYRFPQTATTGKYVSSTNLFEGIPSQQTLNKSIQSINNFGFSVISINPQEFAIIENSTYTNSVNKKQIDELIKLIDEFNEKGIKIVPIGKINSNLVVIVPEWVKNNAGWWAEGTIDDDSFVQGIEYLVQENIISVSEKPQQTLSEQSVPVWVKNNARWWADEQIDDKTFVDGIEYLVKNRIILY